MKEMFPEEEISGTAAREGTAAHAVAEHCLRHNIPPATLLGERRDGFNIDDDMVSAVCVFTRYVQSRVGEDTRKAVTQGRLALETRTNPLPNREDTSGTADITIRDKETKTLEVVDYKHGRGVFVPIEGNLQIQSYLLGAAIADSKQKVKYEKFLGTIVQPRHHMSHNGGVMTAEFTRKDLVSHMGFLQVAVATVDRARKIAGDFGKNLESCAEKLYNSGMIHAGDHCQFCRFVGDCPAQRAIAQEAAMIAFSEEPEDIPIPDDISNVLRWAPHIRRFLDAVEEKGKKMLMDGKVVEGFKIVQARTQRRWRADIQEDSLRAALGSLGILWEDATVTKPKSGVQVLKLIKSKEHQEAFEKEFIVKPEGAPTMVPESDKREAIVVSGPDFDEG